MSYIIKATIGKFNYFVRMDESYAVPERKWELTGLKDNASKIPNKTIAEGILERVNPRSYWPLEIINV